jgi:hypothetical protein
MGSLKRAAHPDECLADLRQWPRTTQDKGGETGEIEEVQFIARRPELRAGLEILMVTASSKKRRS